MGKNRDDELVPCIKCGKKQAKIISYGGVYYVQCPCGKYDSWQFCGFRQTGAIESWNFENRSSIKRGKRDEDDYL